MTIAYFDCFSGAGGDMIVGALLDAGLELAALEQRLSSLGVEGYRLEARKIRKQGFAATQFTVHATGQDTPAFRNLTDIRQIIDGSTLSESVKASTRRVFERLAEAEARVHGVPVEQVHFHEVGAVDTLVDVVGACIGLEMLGVETVYCSPIPVGSGTVTCEHGVLPVPAPATAELLKGVPLADGNETGELTTPTGAAILTTLASRFVPLPAMTVEAIGLGAGTRDGANRPNLLRVFLGKPHAVGQADEIEVLEANLDDISPEAVAYAVERLLQSGALDVYTQPIYMKKGRPAVLLTVLSAPEKADGLEEIIFAETSTFGVRRRTARRTKLDRIFETVTTGFGQVRVKVGRRHGKVVTVAPEFEDCRKAAEAHGASFRDVMQEAVNGWKRQRDEA